MSINTEHTSDWESQRDKLSAFLDGRLTAEGDAQLRHHLQSCGRCTHELAELRRVVSLLHALPQPALPRAFALPAADHAPSAPRSPAVQARRPARHAVGWPRVAQWAGGLVAAAGLLVGIAGVVGQVPALAPLSRNYAASTAGSKQPADQAASATAGTADRATPQGNYGNYGGVAAGADASPSPSSAVAPSATQAPQVPSGQRNVPTSRATQLPALPIIGGTLLVVGTTTFAVGTRSRRRQR
jgi:anti-sigma factor RsiW